MRKIFSAAFLAVFLMAGESFSAQKVIRTQRAIRVNQPAYNSMNFYVHKPANLPKDFYATFDGYLVYKDANGVWHYGSAEKNGIIKTGYVVGSVLPGVVRLKPYNAEISSVAPILGSNRVTEAPNPPEWTRSANFMAISKWQKSVNKIGVLYRPKIPVAWKGNFPEAVYAWTGQNWRQLSAKAPDVTARNILRREIYDLTVLTNKINRLRWTDSDSFILEQYAAKWGYEWAGQIILGRDFY